MANTGWMPIYRRLQDHWLWDDKPFAKGQAWLDLLLLANHNENEFLFGNQIIKNEVGGFITSELKLADRWGWGRKKVRLFLELLEKEQMIVKKGDNKKTTISIVNYSIYADYELAKEQQKNNKGTSREHQRNTNNNNNNDNNINNIKKERKKAASYDAILSNVSDDGLRELYLEYIKMRKMIKSPMTDRALTMLIKKVNNLEPNSIERQKQMLETAIVNNWKSVYPLKEEQKVETKRSYNLEKAKKRMFTEEDE
jgi:hypothetical protein